MTLFHLVSREPHETAEAPDQVASAERDLTYRQGQLDSLVALGKTNKEIAASLNLSEFTVKNHLRRIRIVLKSMGRPQSNFLPYRLLRDSIPETRRHSMRFSGLPPFDARSSRTALPDISLLRNLAHV